MPPRKLRPGLLTHLIDEFGVPGQQAGDYMRSAEVLVVEDVLPSSGSHVAFALRAALLALMGTADATQGGQWKHASRAVADAKVRYEAALRVPGDEAAAALQDLLDRIDEMVQLHGQDALHQQRLIAIMLRRTGAAPISAGLEPVKAFHKLLEDLNVGVHKGATARQGQHLWEATVAILEQLFLPPQVRHAELDALAAVDALDDQHVERALGLLATPQHLHYFLARTRTAEWPRRLMERGLLDPPVGAGGWPMFTAVNSLRESQPDALAEILHVFAARWKRDAQRCWYVARAALDLGAAGRQVVLELVRRHPAHPAIAFFAIDAALASDPSDEFVTDVADVVLNPVDLAAHTPPHLDDLLEALTSGIDIDNWSQRVRLLCQKLRRFPPDDLDRRMLQYDSTSLTQQPELRDDKPVNALLRALTASLGCAWTFATVQDALEVLNELPEDLRTRVRAWFLSVVPDLSADVLADELRTAIASRLPSADDRALLERLEEFGDTAQYVKEWAPALGAAPDPGAVARGLAAREIDPAWSRVREWSGLLPEAAWATWRASLAILSGAFGPVTESRFRAASTGAAGGRSPIELQELQGVSVLDAAARVAAWRPDDAEWLVSARELGRVVEEAVKQDTAAWVVSPVEVAAALVHPTYIAHYLRGLAESPADVDRHGVMDVLELVAAHPWEVVPLGRDDGFDYDPDWSQAERSGVAFIKAAAEAELSLGDRTDRAWELVLRACRDEAPSGIVSSRETDLAHWALERAMNRPATQALEALLALMGQEFRECGAVRQGALTELDRVLALEGADGAEHRAVLAPRISFLRYVAESWTSERMSLLYGEEAPHDLGEITLLLTLRWSRPTRWFLERFASRITRAGAAGGDQALEHVVVGMLWGVPGYEPETLVPVLAAADRLSAAGEDLGRLLQHGHPEQELLELARLFWEQSLTSGSRSLAGFGWMAEVEALEDATWLQLTRRTLEALAGVLDWSKAVADRAGEAAPSAESLDVLNLLVRMPGEPWQQRSVGETALTARDRAGALRDTPEYRRLDSALRERGFL